jgi:hypothetical protein
MRQGCILLLLVFASFFGFTQSPFNYGKNKQVYFIAAKERDSLGIQLLYTIKQYAEKERGGMGENWSVVITSFSENLVTDDWAPFSKDSLFKFNFDSLTTNPPILNGTRYELSNGSILAYGGGGYGSFDWNDFTKVNDSVVLVAISCVGHCGDQPPRFSKSIYDKQGKLTRSIHYPQKDYSDETMTAETPQSFVESLETAYKSNGLSPDTTYFQYDGNGLWLGPVEGLNERKQAGVAWYNMGEEIKKSKYFNQVFVGNQPMDKFIKSKIGYCPQVLFFEIYRNAALLFKYSSSDKKYHRWMDVVLE